MTFPRWNLLIERKMVFRVMLEAPALGREGLLIANRLIDLSTLTA